MLQPPRPLSAAAKASSMQLEINAWMISQFLHGEQGALLATAKIVMAAPIEEAKWYAANQVADEARHVEVYHRYLTEKLGRSYEVNRHLQTLLDDIIKDSRWDMTYLGMQIMVEGLALAAFGMMKIADARRAADPETSPRASCRTSRATSPSACSRSRTSTATSSTSAELREREDFVIEATHLMRDRLLMEQVYERLGWDVPLWVDWAQATRRS